MRMIRTRSSLNGGEGTAQSGIGVVGMACVFPDAHSAEELWESVLAGRRAFRMLPRERVPRDLYFDHDPKTPDKTYSDQVAVITDWSFDPLAFQIPPVTVEATDPTHWLALSTAAAAFRDAGLGLERTDRSRIAVVLGNSLGGEYGRSTYLRYRWPFVERALRRALEYLGRSQEAAVKDLLTTFRHYYLSPFPETTEDSLAGAMSNTIAGRICAQFDLGGGGYTIDGACASSLLAVATACDMLTSGTVDLVLAGGVDISLDPFELVGFAKTRALAEEDIRPYDARAAGMLPGEGCGLVALMRLSDARDSGYRTRAVIRGWGHSTDGRGGITEPQRAGQVLALRRAYERAGYPIATVSLIEGHGTGTARGDQVELNAIIDLLAEGSGEGHCTIGSVKGNIGHCKAAAGAAGLIKTVMALEHKILPPMAACERPSPIFDRSRGRLRPALDGGAWDRGATPRRASVSAFGFGGSNAHIALEESDPPTAPSPDQLALLATAQSTELVILSAADREGLSQRVSNIARVASRLSRAEMTDLAGALADTDGAEAWRIAVVAESPWHLATVLRRAAAALATGAPVADLNDAGAGVLAGTVRGGEPPPRLVGLFPGQGAQRLGMGRHLARRYPFTAQMYAAFDEAIDLAEGLTVWMLRDDRLVEDESAERWNARLRATELAQPAIVAASLAMLAVLDFHGLRPDIVIGHSVGEISALSAAGVFDAVTAVRIAAWRGEAMAGLALRDPGGMMAIQAEAPRVEELLAIAGPDLAISGYNSPRQTVVSGGGEALARLERTCARFGTTCRTLDVSHGFHSARVAPAAAPLRQAMDGLEVAAARRTLVSTTTGGLLAPEIDPRELLATGVSQPVRFLNAVRRADELRPDLWVEIGPGDALSGLVTEIIGGSAAPVLTTDRPGRDGFAQLNTLLAQAYVRGFPISAKRLFAHRFRRTINLTGGAPRVLTNPCERPVAPPDRARGSSPPPQARPAATDHLADALDWAAGWLARRTGYPASSIRPESRLRDDLNLDSIKAAEFIQALLARERRSVSVEPGWANLPVGRIVEAVLRAPDSRALLAREERWRLDGHAPLGGMTEGGDWVRSFSVGLVEAPLDAEEELQPLHPKSVFIVAPRGNSTARAISSGLIDAGLAPLVVDPETLLREDRRPSDLGALIWIPAAADAADDRLGGRRAASRVLEDASVLFRLGRWAVRGLADGSARLRWLVLRLDAAPTAVRVADAGAAFLKSLRLEYPRLAPKWIRAPLSWPAERLGELIAEEIAHAGANVVVAYDTDGLRRTEVALPLVPGTAADTHTLGEDDVILVSGGAKGVTRELAAVLGAQTAATLVLVGTSPEGDPEVTEGFRRLRGAGLRTHYRSCDLTKADAVRALLQEICREHGPVTAVLHGAGVSRLRPFEEATLEGHLEGIRVKAVGLCNILAALPADRLKALYAVSSVLGYTGMPGQADYAFANAWLDGAVAELREAYPGLGGHALAYSAWHGTGLGEKLGAVGFLRSLGVTTIDRERGAAAFDSILRSAPAGARVVVTGRLVPSLEATLFPSPPPLGSRYLERVLRWVPGVELVAEATLSHDRDLYLRDHTYHGTPLLPAVMGIEAMVAAARSVAGRDEPPEVREVRLRHPIVVPMGSEVAVRLCALAGQTDEARQLIRVVIRSETDGFTQDRFAATCLFGPVSEQEPVEAMGQPLPPRVAIDPVTFAPDVLFQGPLFKQIVGLRRLEPGRICITDVRRADGARYFNSDRASGLHTPFPATRDAFLQTMRLLSGGSGLPTAIDKLRFVRPDLAGESVVCRSRLVMETEQRQTLDIDVFTPDGALIESIHGVTVESSVPPPVPQAFQ